MHYFTHAFLPGMAFDKFLDEIIQFPDNSQNVIVVIHLRRDGVAKECTSPATDEISAYLEAACSQASKRLNWIDKSGLSQSTDTLRQSKDRILLLNNSSQYSSYSDVANATLAPDSIIRAFNGMIGQHQKGADITILECQATATNIEHVIASSVLSSNASNLPLTATKAIYDQETCHGAGTTC
jgi:hypothetical protein